MVRGEVRERIEKLRGRIATANESPHMLLGDARNLQKSSHKRLHRIGGRHERFVIAERRDDVL